MPVCLIKAPQQISQDMRGVQGLEMENHTVKWRCRVYELTCVPAQGAYSAHGLSIAYWCRM